MNKPTNENELHQYIVGCVLSQSHSIINSLFESGNKDPEDVVDRTVILAFAIANEVVNKYNERKKDEKSS